jgi:hypothetical protein
MTCVIATPEYIAADSRESAGTCYTVPKILVHNQRIYGVCGDSWMCGQFIDWVRSGFRKTLKPEWNAISGDEDFMALELSAGGIRRWDKHVAVWDLAEPHWVGIGSGSSLAIGALEAGATIEEAFEIVFRRSGDCAPPLQIVHLKNVLKGSRK